MKSQNDPDNASERSEQANRTQDLEGYEVGYRRPPIHSRFKPGTSGNPSGRPRGRKNLTTVVRNYALGRMKVTEGGHEKMLPRFDALLRTMWTRAFKGDPKALVFVLQLVREAGLMKEETPLPEQELTAEDQEIIHEFLERAGASRPKRRSDRAPASKRSVRRNRRGT